MGRRIRLTQQERLNVLERDSFCCVVCGVGGRRSDVILEVDHINEDPSDNRMENLQTLCIKCHNNKHPWRWTKTKYRLFTFSARREHGF